MGIRQKGSLVILIAGPTPLIWVTVFEEGRAQFCASFLWAIYYFSRQTSKFFRCMYARKKGSTFFRCMYVRKNDTKKDSVGGGRVLCQLSLGDMLNVYSMGGETKRFRQTPIYIF